MPTSPTNSAIEHLRRAVLLRDGAGLGDGELLGCFIERHDEAALAALIRRHGPMVWGVCRRLLSHHDAEDAFKPPSSSSSAKRRPSCQGRWWGTGCMGSPTRRRYRHGEPSPDGGRGKYR